MHAIKNLIFIAAMAAAVQPAIALPSLRLEATPPANAGAISIDELGPVFSHPREEQQPAPTPSQAEAKPPQKNDILSLFQEDKPKLEEKNPLEEQAKNELKILDDPENPAAAQQPPVQVGENKPSDVIIQAENAPKEVELDNINPDSKNLPNILR